MARTPREDSGKQSGGACHLGLWRDAGVSIERTGLSALAGMGVMFPGRSVLTPADAASQRARQSNEFVEEKHNAEAVGLLLLASVRSPEESTRRCCLRAQRQAIDPLPTRDFRALGEIDREDHEPHRQAAEDPHCR
jgi:hypothetical protein